MPPYGMLRRVVLVRTDVSEERVASIIMVTRIGVLGTTLVVISNRSTRTCYLDLSAVTAVCFLLTLYNLG
jgi:hypothetical protein